MIFSFLDERFIWFDSTVRANKYPNTTSLANQFEISIKTAQRDIEFMRDRLLCPLEYDSSEKGYYYENDTFTLPMVYLSSGELSSLLKNLLNPGRASRELGQGKGKATRKEREPRVNDLKVDLGSGFMDCGQHERGLISLPFRTHWEVRFNEVSMALGFWGRGK